jgi:HSP20 family molecular chaperone IbpA
MARIEIEHLKPQSESATRLMTELNNLGDRIRSRAFELFEGRGGEHGSDLSDWLQAEREIRFPAPIEVSQETGIRRFRISIPDFNKKDLQVQLLDNNLIVTGRAEELAAAAGGSAKTVRQILYQVSLPEGARTGEIVADGKGSTLDITVPVSDETASGRTDKTGEQSGGTEDRAS